MHASVSIPFKPEIIVSVIAYAPNETKNGSGNSATRVFLNGFQLKSQHDIDLLVGRITSSLVAVENMISQIDYREQNMNMNCLENMVNASIFALEAQEIAACPCIVLVTDGVFEKQISAGGVFETQKKIVSRLSRKDITCNIIHVGKATRNSAVAGVPGNPFSYTANLKRLEFFAKATDSAIIPIPLLSRILSGGGTVNVSIYASTLQHALFTRYSKHPEQRQKTRDTKMQKKAVSPGDRIYDRFGKESDMGDQTSTGVENPYRLRTNPRRRKARNVSQDSETLETLVANSGTN